MINIKHGNKMKLSNILSASVALSALAFTASSFAALTYSGLQTIFDATTEVHSTFAVDSLDSENQVDVTLGFTTSDGGSGNAYNIFGHGINVNDTFGIVSMKSSIEYSLIGAGSGFFSGNYFTITADGTMHYYDANGPSQVAGFGQQFGFFFTDSSEGTTAYTSNAGEVLGYTLSDIDVEVKSWATPISFISGDSDSFKNAGEDDWILAFNTTTTDGGYTDAVVLVKDVSLIPEPSIIALMGLGLVGIGVAARRKQKAA
jgi:hypothetical protein